MDRPVRPLYKEEAWKEFFLILAIAGLAVVALVAYAQYDKRQNSSNSTASVPNPQTVTVAPKPALYVVNKSVTQDSLRLTVVEARRSRQESSDQISVSFLLENTNSSAPLTLQVTKDFVLKSDQSYWYYGKQLTSDISTEIIREAPRLQKGQAFRGKVNFTVPRNAVLAQLSYLGNDIDVTIKALE